MFDVEPVEQDRGHAGPHGSFVQMIARLKERGDIAEAQDRIYPTPLLDP